MKKIESLNNAQKTVLKLEKEINEISSNISRVKNKDHTTMKKIINNINYLLTNDNQSNKYYPKEINYLNYPEENKKNEENQDIKDNQYILIFFYNTTLKVYFLFVHFLHNYNYFRFLFLFLVY